MTKRSHKKKIDPNAPETVQSHLLKKKPLFLAAFRRTCNLSAAADSIGISRSLHYRWMEKDPAYKAEYDRAIPEVCGGIESTIASLGLKGHFEPLVYKGDFRYAKRKRTMCVLADGTQKFEDELPKKAKVLARKEVLSADGDQLGVWHIDTGMLGKLAAAYMPDRYGTTRLTGKDGAPLVISTPDDAKRALLSKLAGFFAAGPGDGSGGEPE